MDTAAPVFQVAPAGQRPVGELTYATVQNAPRYRTITRFLLESHEHLQDWLSPEAIMAAVAPYLGPDYTPELLEQDLKSLCDWGNLLRDRDQRRARSLSDFNRTRSVYRLGPLSLELERLLRRLEQQGGSGGTLDSTLLERLWVAVDSLTSALERQVPSAMPVDALRTEVVGPWRTVLDSMQALQEGARDFHQTLSTANPVDAARPEAFLLYKNAIRDHLAGFLSELQAYAPRMQSRFNRWRALGLDTLLVNALTDHDTRGRVAHLTAGGALMASEEVRAQVHAPAVAGVLAWLGPEGGAATLMRKSKDAILFIVAQTERIVTRHAVGDSRRRDLAALARLFAHLDMVQAPTDVANRIWARAFGACVPRHLRGGVDNSTLLDESTSAWRQPPSAYPLRIVRRGAPRQGVSAKVADHSADLAAARAQAEADREHERLLWTRLLSEDRLDTEHLLLEDPRLRTPLLDLIARARLDDDGTAVLRDGRRVRVAEVRPADQGTSGGTAAVNQGLVTYGRIVAPDGTLLLPRVQLTAAPGLPSRS